MPSTDSATLLSDGGEIRRLFEQAPGFIIIMRGPDHIVEFVNDAHRRLFGSDGWQGRTIRNAYHSFEGAGFLEQLDHVFTTGESFEANGATISFQRTPDSAVETRAVTFIYAPLYAEDGAIDGIFCEGFDVTAHRQTQVRHAALAALSDVVREEEEPDAIAYKAAEILGRTLDVSRAGYGTIDTRAETISIERDWNAPGIASLAGVLQFRDYGSYIDDLKAGRTVIIVDADLDPRTREGADSLKAISAHSFVNMPVTEQGDAVALLFLNHASPRDWSDDDLDLIREFAERTRIAVERRRAEIALRESAAALAELNRTLEERVAERTSQLVRAEEALRQSQKMEAVGQLTGGLAHDFNNLLTGIGGSFEMIRGRIAQGRMSDVERYVTAGQGAVKRAAALTHRLLAFSRRQTLNPKPIDINRMVRGIEELVRRTVGPSTDVEVVGSTGLWTTLVDPNQLENALLNLCINARDAMPDGGKLTIETANRWLDARAARQQDLPMGQYVSLCVTDTGVGMSADVKAKAFDPFFTTKPLGEGTGLGLSMIYGFARQSGGQVRVYSELGQGTTMCIYLPRHEGEEPIEMEVHDEQGLDLSADGETVLVIDDEPTIRMLVGEVLAEAGFAAIEAADGPSGLKILESNARVDLLITDVGLPGGLNGRQVADAARALRPDLKVLFITGYAENAVVRDGRLEPGMSLITKPFEMDLLARKIREALAGS